MYYIWVYFSRLLYARAYCERNKEESIVVEI